MLHRPFGYPVSEREKGRANIDTKLPIPSIASIDIKKGIDTEKYQKASILVSDICCFDYAGYCSLDNLEEVAMILHHAVFDAIVRGSPFPLKA